MNSAELLATSLLLAVLLLSGIASAQIGGGATGSSSIVFQRGNISVEAGAFFEVNYTLESAGGSSGTGSIASVTDTYQLTAEGIMVQEPYHDRVYPPSTGRLLVSVSSSTPSGRYNITMQATGSQPSGPSNFTVIVLGNALQAPIYTTVQNTTIASTTVAQQALNGTLNSTTVPQTILQQLSGNGTLWELVGMLVVFIGIIYLITKKSRSDDLSGAY